MDVMDLSGIRRGTVKTGVNEDEQVQVLFQDTGKLETVYEHLCVHAEDLDGHL